MSRWTDDGHLMCDNCDNPRSKALNKEGIALCQACAFGEAEAFVDQINTGDVIYREDRNRT